MNSKIRQIEDFNFLVGEIYKNLCALYDAELLSISEVNNINCLLRGKVSQWCDENMNGEEYTDYILNIFERIKEEMPKKEEGHEGMVWDLSTGKYVYPENLPSHWHYHPEEEE